MHARTKESEQESLKGSTPEESIQGLGRIQANTAFLSVPLKRLAFLFLPSHHFSYLRLLIPSSNTLIHKSQIIHSSPNFI